MCLPLHPDKSPSAAGHLIAPQNTGGAAMSSDWWRSCAEVNISSFLTPANTTWDNGRPCCCITRTMLKLIYANTAQNCLQAPSLGGWVLSWPWWGQQCLPACNFLSLFSAQAHRKITATARENNCLLLSFNDVSKATSWSFMLKEKRVIGGFWGGNNVAVYREMLKYAPRCDASKLSVKFLIIISHTQHTHA